MGSLNTEGTRGAWNPSLTPGQSDDDAASHWLDAIREAEPPPPPGATTAATPAAPAPSDTAARKALAAKMVVGNQTATQADIKLVTDHLAATMPLKEMQALDSAGIKVKVTEGSVATALPKLKDDQPRGWDAGNTWKTVSGTYWQPTKEIIIATHDGPNGSRELPGPQQSASADVLLHESAHALNRIGFFFDKSDSSAFKEAYADTKTGKLSAYYYHQPDHPGAGADEAFAESNAMYIARPEQLQAESPKLYGYWKTYFGQ